VQQALAEHPGDLLVFLPGQREIARVQAGLQESLNGDVEVLALHGELPVEQQARVLQVASDGRRRVVLATNVAESSVTLPGVRVVIAGGDAGQAAALGEQARSLGVADRTTIIARHVDGPDKEALFAHARAFAMTSLSENFGLAAFEAMRRGLPVLAVPDVGMSEIVRDADAGLVVAADPGSIGGALKRLIDDRAGARAMGERGRERVVAQYGWSAVAGRMEDVYRAAIGNKGPRS